MGKPVLQGRHGHTGLMPSSVGHLEILEILTMLEDAKGGGC